MPLWYLGTWDQKQADIALQTTRIAIPRFGALCDCSDVVLLAYLTVIFVVVATLTCEMRAESRCRVGGLVEARTSW